MKSIQLIWVCVALIFFASCKKKIEDPAPSNTQTPNSANVSIYFANEVDGQALELGLMKYTNAAGNPYQVNLLKYYVTNVILVKADNTEVKINNYDLIDASEPSTCMVNAPAIPNGTYTKIKFNIGIPVDRNHNGAQDGDLDPVMGMIWDWNTGYVFFKHEGKYKNTSGVEKNMAFHFATDRALTSIEVPITSDLVVNGADRKLKLKFNLNNLYTTPTNVDFNIDNSRQSSTAADYPWIDNLKLSFADAFIFDRVE
jgi:hypothetical protein